MKVNEMGTITPNIPSGSLTLATHSVLADLSSCEYLSLDGDRVIHTVTNDIYLLFNTERLNLLGNDGVNNFIQNINRNLSQNGMPPMSDDVLFKFIKSRQIQSLSELLQWSNYLNDNAKDIEEAFQSELQSNQNEVDSDNNINTQS